MPSYLGQDVFPYTPFETVDQTALETGMMMGSDTAENLEVARQRDVKKSPARSLLALWFFVLLLYSMLAWMFRRYSA